MKRDTPSNGNFQPVKVKLLAFALALILVSAGCQPAAQETAVNQPLATPAASTPTPVPPTIEPSATSTLTPTVTASPTPFQPESFSFVLTADMRYFTGPGVYDKAIFFRGAAQAIADLGSTSFMITAGDIDLPWNTRWTLDEVFGSSYLWYPVVGNHEYLPDSMNFLRAYNYDANGELPPNLVRQGPESCPQTMYSFDYLNAHFVVLNEYCTQIYDMSGVADVNDVVYNWLEEDLRATHQPVIFVIGHEPAYPQPDALTGRVRHENVSLDEYPEHRDRFWNLMKAYDVAAYLCGHTHNYSAVQIDGLWQIDGGHARGIGDNVVPSTFVLFHVFQNTVIYETYRDDMQGGKYTLFESGALKHLHQPVPAFPQNQNQRPDNFLTQTRDPVNPHKAAVSTLNFPINSHSMCAPKLCGTRGKFPAQSGIELRFPICYDQTTGEMR